MNQGYICSLLQIPSPWPVKCQTTLTEKIDQDDHFKLHAYPDGHISYESLGSINPFNYHTQPIKIAPGMMVVLSIHWTGQDIEIELNNTVLRPFHADVTAVEILGKPHEKLPFELSINHRDALENCRDWTEWRRIKFAETTRIVNLSRRLKTSSEQLCELENELQALAELCEQVREGKTHMLTKVAGSLRSLIYWEEKPDGKLIRSYNPLLLRLASRLQLPLPVFVLPESSVKLSDILDRVDWHHSQTDVSLTKNLPLQIIFDLQNWLTRQVIEICIDEVSAPRKLTCKEVLKEASNTLGGSHYDEDIPIALDTLMGSLNGNTDALSTLLLATADVVLGLGEYVITSFLESELAE